jgi:hypothetical protein
MTETISPSARVIIDRLSANPFLGKVDRIAVENAITQHLSELGLPPMPFRWYSTARDGWSAAESAGCVSFQDEVRQKIAEQEYARAEQEKIAAEMGTVGSLFTKAG